MSLILTALLGGVWSDWFKRRLPQADTPPAVDASPADGSVSLTGGDDSQEPVVVWEAANRLEAEIVAGRLASEEIPAIIRGEALGAIYGLTTGSLAVSYVLVPAPLADKAVALLAADADTDTGTDTDTGAEWDEHDPGVDDSPPQEASTRTN